MKEPNSRIYEIEARNATCQRQFDETGGCSMEFLPTHSERGAT